MKKISHLILSILGWKSDCRLDIPQKFLLITYPHTSNWDFFYSLLIQWDIGIKVYWIAKHSLFVGPMKFIMKKLNAIPVNRLFPKNFIPSIVDEFNLKEYRIIAIAPEGTRKRTRTIKTGFYEIAMKAHIPFVLGYLDYSKKVGGLGKILYPSGDINIDLNLFNEFYINKKPFYPEKASPLVITSGIKK